MKRTTKFLAALLATFLVFGSIPIFAEPNAPNPSPGLPFDTGSLTIHKYIMPDLDRANLPNDGGEIEDPAEDQSGANTYDTEIPASAEEISGIKFKVYQIDFEDYIENRNLTNTPLDSVYRQLIDDFNQMGWVLDLYENPTKIISAAKDGSSNPYEFPVIQVTNGDGITGFSGSGADSVLISNVASDSPKTNRANGLPKGFYLVVEQLNDQVASISFPFIVAVPMTNAEGDGWIQNVHVYPKNGDLSITKTIDRNAVHVGELVNFTVTVSVPADIRTYYDFFMVDQLDECLTYKPGSLKVYGIGPQTVYDIDTLTDALGGGGTGDMSFDPATAPAGSGDEIDPVDGDRHNFDVQEPAAINDNTLMVTFFKNIEDKADSATHPDGFTPPNTWQESREEDNDGFWTLRQYNFVRFEFSAYVNEKILDRAGVNPYDPAGNSNDDRKGDYWGDPDADDGDATGAQSWAYTIFNQANIWFRNKFDYKADKDLEDNGQEPRGPRNRKSNFVKTHSAALYIEKIDANTGTPLAGAKFKIADCEACARAGRFLRLIYVDNSGTRSATQLPRAKGERESIYTKALNNGTRAGQPSGYIVSIEAPYLPGTAHTGAPDNPKWTAAGAEADWIEETKLVNSQTDPFDFSNWGASWGAANMVGPPKKAIARFEGLKEFGTWNQDYNETVPPAITSTTPTTYEDLEVTPGAEKTVTTPSSKYLTYWLVEVQAPPVPGNELNDDGSPSNSYNRPYNLLLEPIEVGFSYAAPSGDVTKHTSNFDNWYTINGGQIRNSNKFTLPLTGGLGTILFTAGGAAIIGLGIYLFIVSMKRKKQKDN